NIMTKINIGFVLPAYLQGGAEKVIDTIVTELNQSQKYNFVLIAASYSDESIKRAKNIGFKVIQLSDPKKFTAECTTIEVIDIINSLKIDTLIMSVVPLTKLNLLKQNIPESTKIIFHLHSKILWEVIAKLAISKGIVLRKNSKWAYIKWLVLKYGKERFLKVYTHRYTRRYKHIIKHVDYFWVLCEQYRKETLDLLSRNLLQKYIHKIIAINNPIDYKFFKQNTQDKESKEIIYCGRLGYEDKRVDRLLNIWSKIEHKVPDWKLKIIGDGKEKYNLIHQSKKLGLKQVEFINYSPDPRIHYSSATILCLTSTFEGWPMVLIEALAQKVIPIAFACSAGVTEILSNGRGVAVTPFDEDEYADKLHELMTNESLRKTLLQNAEGYAETFDAPIIAKKWEEYI
ncbi:MAG: glycosyltransferase, partial [Paramuribaculum sp.]|nr:glycosyltransferase [Paramuribaculum sp.]